MIARLYQVASLAKVVVTTSVPDFVSPKSATSRNVHLKRADIRLSHLPDVVRQGWESQFTPQIIKYIGTLQPWSAFSPSNRERIQDIFAEVFPSMKQLEDDQDLSFIVFAKIADIVVAWQHRFSHAAEKYLVKTIFKENVDDNREDRAEWCQWALATDLSAEELDVQPEGGRRFYFREYEEPEEAGGKIKVAKGIFQSPLIVATLATHYLWLQRLDPSALRSYDPPVGALVLSIQAWTTGSEVKPPGPLANFSASNWSDRENCDGPSATVFRPLTTDVMDIVEQLDAKAWERIEKEVNKVLQQHKKRNNTKTFNAENGRAQRIKPVFKLLDHDVDNPSDSEGSDAEAQAQATGV
ncbi:hypothetical protein H0H92_010025 [Tricholoma furcatifolium]|nr:hypothetical protein H0H92_010025 [Tricholoma furcatifolium]